MPEFVLNTEGTGAPWHSLDGFTQGFIEAAFFTETSHCYDSSEFFTEAAQEDVREGRADGSVPSDAGPAEIDRDSFCRIKDLCDEFQREHAALLSEAYERDDYDETQAGRDLYFTRAGHGVGYWDRKQLEPQGDEWEALQRPLDTWSKEESELHRRLKDESLGERLSKAAGRGEISLDAYQDEAAASGFLVSFYIS